MKQPSTFLKNCPSCNKNNFSNFYTYPHKIDVKYSYCNSCSLIFQNPTYSKKEWDNFYKYDYRNIYEGSPTPTESSLLLQKKRAEFYLKILTSQKISFKSHLDVGSSAGELLSKIKKEYKLEYQAGIELDHEYRKYSIDKGAKVFESLEAAVEEGDRYDLITINHVLEHIPKPNLFLNTLSKLINSNGYLFLEVPNIEGGMGAMEIAHPLAFSSSTIKEILTNAGFEILYIKLHGEPKILSPSCKNYILTIAKFSCIKLNKIKWKKNSKYKTRILMQRNFNWKESTLIYWLKFPYRILKYGYKF